MRTSSVTPASSWRRQGTAAVAATCLMVALSMPGMRASDPQAASGQRAGTAKPQTAEAQTKALAQFMLRVNDYVTLHKKHEDTLPAIGDKASPEEMDRHQRALIALLARARAGAKQGDIFTPDAQAYVRLICRRAFSHADGKNLIAMILDENPVGLKIAVNQKYPTEVPLSTMPPDLLAALPKLPEELEYRFVGDRLILFDVHAQMIVDWVDNVLPVAPGRK